jgi:5'-nucleotidase
MSAAMEAAIEGIPAVGFSLLDYEFEADFTAAAHFAKITAEKIMHNGLPANSLLNVNIPKLKLTDIKGIKVARQAVAKWVEEFDERRDPRGKKYYWLTGKFESNDHSEDTDEWALANGYVSVVPVQFDLTAHQHLQHIKQMME